VQAQCAVYHDEFCGEVRDQLRAVDAVLVWVNPIVDGRDRSHLDAMLREVAASGARVSAHPDTILKLGTKKVLYDTREVGWGTETHLHPDLASLRTGLIARLPAGNPRILKQYRGHSGDGVWKVELANKDGGPATEGELQVRARHALRGSPEEILPLSRFLQRCERYFTHDRRMIEQAYQPRLPEGMIRCYLVRDKVEGFGHQAINALCPAPSGVPASAPPTPSPRLYHPPTVPEFQALKHKLESEWLPHAQRLLGLTFADLPILWDCDFLLGAPGADGHDTYVLCEINVSSVAPFPESVVQPLVRATLAAMR